MDTDTDTDTDADTIYLDGYGCRHRHRPGQSHRGGGRGREAGRLPRDGGIPSRWGDPPREPFAAPQRAGETPATPMPFAAPQRALSPLQNPPSPATGGGGGVSRGVSAAGEAPRSGFRRIPRRKGRAMPPGRGYRWIHLYINLYR